MINHEQSLRHLKSTIYHYLAYIIGKMSLNVLVWSNYESVEIFEKSTPCCQIMTTGSFKRI